MRSFVLIALLACTHAAVLRSDKAGETPKLLGLTAINPMGIVVEWSPVKKLGDEPVVGYKVLIQQLKDAAALDLSNGPITIPAVIHPKVEIAEDPQGNSVKEFIVRGADNTSYKYTEIEKGRQYEIRVKAFTANTDGPLSDKMGIKFEA
ncbi:hypothetical protein JYU34_006280 [Plutella xylostella]|uniref:Fibronectin type-III domain-containing protein n=1 Tax=Plutella xylostella TaxID=51655 RepID=A0ABQ7QRP9_PLUXY|nr:hypothetical protein JYU34_006280 [Plutella xylostella]